MDRKTPLVSVVIPVYNAERFVERAANSVLMQPNSDQIELILVNDGSTDGSGQICDEITSRNANARVFHKQNGGASSARNLGLDHSSGKYLAFLDSDDWWEADFFSCELVDKLACPNSADIFCFSYQKISPSLKYRRRYRVADRTEIYDSPSYSHVHSQHHSAFLYKSDYLKSYGFRYLPTKVWEDVPFTHLCCTFARSITCINRIMFSYWMNQDSCMHTEKTIEKFHEHYKAEYYVNRIYHEHGIPYDIDRILISTITSFLNLISAEGSYFIVKQMLHGTEFDLLSNSNVQPWTCFQRDVYLWRQVPFFAYWKNRLKRRPVLLVKQLLISFKATRPLAEILQYKLIER